MRQSDRSGIAEPIWHGTNLFGTVVANTPFLGESLGSKAASLPLIKRFGGMVKVLHTDPTPEEAASDMREMAKLGMLGDKFGSVTFSNHYAQLTGAAQHRFSLSPVLWGPEGIDVRARLFMYRLAKQIYPASDGPGMHLFVNQLGQYARPLQGTFERWLKGTAAGRIVSPFYTAGSTMMRNGVNSWTLGGPGPKARPDLRAWKLMNSALALAALAAVTQKAVTGKWPWEDKASKLMAIPIATAFTPRRDVISTSTSMGTLR